MTGNINNVVKVIQRILIFSVLVIVLDFLFGFGLEYLYFKQKDGLYARTTYGLDQTKAELLIFGSSSANHHYNPGIFEEILNLTAYNEGRDGTDILYHTAILKGILKRYTPKIILLNLAPMELSADQGYDRLSSLLPYIKKYPEMKEIISLRARYENLKLFSKIYPYNSTFLTIINGLYGFTGKKNQDKGYLPLSGTFDTYKYTGPVYPEHSLDTNRVKALADFIYQCTTRRIQLFLVFSPVYDFNDQKTKTIEEVKSRSENNAFYYNFIDDPRFKKQSSLFKDNGHMNHDGATKFSKIMASLVLEDLERKNATTK